MDNKWVVYLIIGFVLFFVLTNPGAAGLEGRSFFGWLGDLVESLGVFFEGLFSGEGDTTTTTTGG
ncbi:MAG: hypothetical protein AAF962_09200 [Actinomycetota bacterium]